MRFFIPLALLCLLPTTAFADLINPLVAECDKKAVGAACSKARGRCVLLPWCRWDTCSERKRCVLHPDDLPKEHAKDPWYLSEPDERAQLACLGQPDGTTCSVEGTPGTCGPRTRCVLHQEHHPDKEDLEVFVYCQEHHACRQEGERTPQLTPGVHRGIPIEPDAMPRPILGAVGELLDPEPCAFQMRIGLSPESRAAVEKDCEDRRRVWRKRNPCRRQPVGTPCGDQGKQCLLGRECIQNECSHIMTCTTPDAKGVVEGTRQLACAGVPKGGTCEVQGVAGSCEYQHVWWEVPANKSLNLYVPRSAGVLGCFPERPLDWWPRAAAPSSPGAAPAEPGSLAWLWAVLGAMMLGWAIFGERKDE